MSGDRFSPGYGLGIPSVAVGRSEAVPVPPVAPRARLARKSSADGQAAGASGEHGAPRRHEDSLIHSGRAFGLGPLLGEACFAGLGHAGFVRLGLEAYERGGR